MQKSGGHIFRLLFVAIVAALTAPKAIASPPNIPGYATVDGVLACTGNATLSLLTCSLLKDADVEEIQVNDGKCPSVLDMYTESQKDVASLSEEWRRSYQQAVETWRSIDDTKRRWDVLNNFVEVYRTNHVATLLPVGTTISPSDAQEFMNKLMKSRVDDYVLAFINHAAIGPYKRNNYFGILTINCKSLNAFSVTVDRATYRFHLANDGQTIADNPSVGLNATIPTEAAAVPPRQPTTTLTEDAQMAHRSDESPKTPFTMVGADPKTATPPIQEDKAGRAASDTPKPNSPDGVLVQCRSKVNPNIIDCRVSAQSPIHIDNIVINHGKCSSIAKDIDDARDAIQASGLSPNAMMHVFVDLEALRVRDFNARSKVRNNLIVQYPAYQSAYEDALRRHVKRAALVTAKRAAEFSTAMLAFANDIRGNYSPGQEVVIIPLRCEDFTNYTVIVDDIDHEFDVQRSNNSN